MANRDVDKSSSVGWVISAAMFVITFVAVWISMSSSRGR